MTAIFALPAAANPPDPERPDIELTVRASIDRPFTWEIEKTADVEKLKLKPGETATVNYSVTVKETEGATGWSAFGEILVYNKELDPVTVNSVANVVSGVGPATVTCQGAPLPRQLNSGAQLRCRFTIELPDDSNRISTATASVDDGEFTASAPIEFATALDNRIDTCVAISDSLFGLVDEQTCVNKANKTVTYSWEVGPYEKCGEYRFENTAWAITNHTETRVEDTHVLKVDVECKKKECKDKDKYGWWGHDRDDKCDRDDDRCDKHDRYGKDKCDRDDDDRCDRDKDRHGKSYGGYDRDKCDRDDRDHDDRDKDRCKDDWYKDKDKDWGRDDDRDHRD
ncbi:MAG TPA: hypothetical protein VD769_01235, partial [Gaiellaceae bacterium]|nr:hypothetical protein [Gaiellaceae bacterium]